MMTNERIEPNRQWLVKLTQGASTMLGLGQTAIAITRVIRKRDLGSLWELDPVAAPPKRVQRHLLGTVEQAVPSTSQDSMRDNERYSILRMQLKFAMPPAQATPRRVSSMPWQGGPRGFLIGSNGQIRGRHMDSNLRDPPSR